MAKKKVNVDTVEVEAVDRKTAALQRYNITDAAIEEMREKCMCLTIDGLNDKAGYELVKSSRAMVRKKRTEVEAVRKELKADALEYGRMVDGEAKRITAELLPIEDYLKAQEQEIDDEKKRIADEEQRLIQEKIDSRNDRALAVNLHLHVSDLHGMTDEAFEDRLKIATQEFEKAQELLRYAEQKKAEEAEALAKQKAEQEKIAEQQAEAQAKIDAENARIAKAKADFEAEKNKAESDKQHAAAIAQAKLDAAAEVEKKLLAEAKAEADAAAKAAQMRPDKEKLLGYAEYLENSVLPEVSSPEASKVVDNIVILTGKICTYIREQADKL